MPSAYDTIRGLLFSAPAPGQLSATPRARLFGANTGTAFAANEQLQLAIEIALPEAPLGPGNAYLFELAVAAFGLGPTNNGYTVQGLSASLVDANAKLVMPVAQGSVTTTGGVDPFANVSAILTPQPPLITAEDMNSFAAARAVGPVTQLAIGAVVTNGATAQTIDMLAWILVRVLHGLQEG